MRRVGDYHEQIVLCRVERGEDDRDEESPWEIRPGVDWSRVPLHIVGRL